MSRQFTEAETESFYDLEDAVYRSFWDSEGSLHWGYFDPSVQGDFMGACAFLNRLMARKGHIDAGARVLDLGCGNGVAARWLADEYGCHVTGIDLSSVRVNNANAMAADAPPELRARLAFHHGSATNLPFDDAAFTHVWSQAAIYHVPDKETALKEARRVLQPGGLLVLDDLLKPTPVVSEQSRRYVYERLLFDTPFSFTGYQDCLHSIGFRMLEAEDLSAHLRQSYTCLGVMAREHAAGDVAEKLTALSFAYGKMVEAVDRGELGWAYYVAEAVDAT